MDKKAKQIRKEKAIELARLAYRIYKQKNDGKIDNGQNNANETIS